MKRSRYTTEEDNIILLNSSNIEVGRQLGRTTGSISVRRSVLVKKGFKAKRSYIKKSKVENNERLSATGGMMNFKVNGTEISIERGVKQILVGKNSIEINL